MKQLIEDIVSYCAARGITETTFGSYAMNDSQFVRRLRDGGRCWPETEAKARAYMAENPPKSNAA